MSWYRTPAENRAGAEDGPPDAISDARVTKTARCGSILPGLGVEAFKQTWVPGRYPRMLQWRTCG